VGGKLVAYRNVCPHAGAPVCQGRVCGTTLPGEVGEYSLAREGEILRCPWHGWEFDLLTGLQLVDPKMKLKSYEVAADPKSLEAVTIETEAETVFVVLP
jgi:nitrite reductase (NADH) small subunit